MNAEIPHLCHYPDLGSGSDWMKHKFSTNQKHWVVMCHQYGVPALRHHFEREPFSQAIRFLNPLSPNGDQLQFSSNHIHRLSRD